MKEDLIFILDKTLRLLSRKNKEYSNSHEKTIRIIKIIYGQKINETQYKDLLYIIRILDKINRISYIKSEKEKLDEWIDIIGYATLVSSQYKKHGKND